MTLVPRLKAKSATVLARAEGHGLYRRLFATGTPPAEVAALLRNVLLQTFYYGHHVTEAVFTAIGRLPKTKPQLMRPLVEQVLDEVYHPEMAAKDFVKLGGDPARVDPARISPASLAVAATCRMIAERESPFAYLGFLALLESTTPVLTERLMPVLQRLGMGTASKFVPHHAKEDQAHADLIWAEIEKVVAAFPEAEERIEFGSDCLALVYPGPIWDEALARAAEELGGGAAG